MRRQASTSPRSLLLAALAVAVAAALFGGAPALTLGAATQALVLLALRRWVVRVHGRWIDRWVLAATATLALALVAARVEWPWDAPLVLCLLADAGAALLLAGWFDPVGLAARAADEADPTESHRLRRRARRLGWAEGDAPPASSAAPPLPADTAALEARLDFLMAWRAGAFEPAPAVGPAAAAREVLAHAAGALLFVAPPAALLLALALPAREALVLTHLVALALFVWGLAAVGGDRLARAVDGPLKAAAVFAGLAGAAAVVAMLVYRIAAQVRFGVGFDPGEGAAFGARGLSTALAGPEGRLAAVAFFAGFAAPAALWAWLARADATPDRPPTPDLAGAPWPRRISSTLGGTPWFLAATAVFVVDSLTMSLLLGAGRFGALLLLGPAVAASHALVAALAFGGLRVADRRRRAGVRRTVEDERRRVVAALVRLREARAAAPEPPPEARTA
ncbi:MAG: hypothetical protein M9894_06295 [Planctomycetes bacterium]|nr:hypothetical protein [Planctomycetota bacterium]